MAGMLAAALAAHDAGLCVLPPKEDGTKKPDADSWTAYQKTRPTRERIANWYAGGRRSGIGYVPGAVSGNLEILDFDEPGAYRAFVELARAAGLGDLVDRIEAGYLEETPSGGRHWYYRCEGIAGNTKLARRPKRPEEMADEGDTIQVLIETRGEGGYIVAAPSNGRVHETGKPYRLLRGGVATIPAITPEERGELFRLARSLDELPRAEPREGRAFTTGEGKPGADFNARGDVLALLEKRGWDIVFAKNGVTHLRRPGKTRGTSATFGYDGTRYFYPFTTSTAFEAERAYSPFAVYAILEHDGDFGAAAKALAAEGYGAPGQEDAAQAPDAGPTRIDAPTFPLDVLPPPVRAYVAAAAESLSVPPEMVAVPLLGLAGGLIGDRLHLVLKHSWREYPTLYLAIVARPGSAKTPALGLAKWPLDALQKAAHERYTERMAAYQDELAAWKAGGRERGEPEPAKPRLRHYFSTDLTVEALAGILAEAPGVAVIRDEISGWVAALDQYKGGKGSDRQQYLSLWSAQTLKVDRKTGGSLYVPEPVACVVGGIQPDLAGTLHDAAKRRDGFVERILPTVPEVAPAEWTDAAPSTEQYRDVLAVFQTLDGLMYQATANESGLPRGHGVSLSSEARAAFVSWHGDNARLVAAAGGLAEGFYSKLPAHVARLALILHALWRPDDPRVVLSADRMRDAIELGEFFRAHIGRFLALLKATAPAGSAGLDARILRFLRIAAEADGWVAHSEIYRRLRNASADEMAEALERLIGAGMIERRTVPTATKPSDQYRIRISHYSHNSGAAGPETPTNGSGEGKSANNGKCESPSDDAWAGAERVRL